MKRRELIKRGAGAAALTAGQQAMAISGEEAI
jgi:hypothetical protein